MNKMQPIKQLGKRGINDLDTHVRVLRPLFALESLGCPRPCRRTSYAIDVNYFYDKIVDDNNDNDVSTNDFLINVYSGLNELVAEENVEFLVFDTFALLIAAGAFLGLFLGLSCRTIFFGVLDLFQQHFTNPET